MNYTPPSPPMIPAKWHGGDQTPDLIVMHSTVSPCAVGGALSIAHYFANTSERVSAHYTVDPKQIFQCVPDHKVAYHCGYNANSLGIEMCDYPSRINMRRWYDKAHRMMFTKAVELVAELCLAYDIPPYYRSARSLKAGNKGVTTHAQMTSAYHMSTHWDPGMWPRVRFMRAVRKEIQRIEKVNK